MNLNYHTIVVCVNFADYLKLTYSFNKEVLHDFTVISSYTDEITKNFCKENNIFLYQTDAFYINNCVFNKAAAINSFLLNNFSRFNSNEWLLFTDSDVIITNPIKRIIELKNSQSIHHKNLISCPRKIYKDHNAFIKNEYTVEEIGFYGYFQFFHKNMIINEIVQGIAPVPEWHDASQYDIRFADKYWSKEKDRIYLMNSYADHIGDIGVHWQGRI